MANLSPLPATARVKNSQAMRDWVRAARDLQAAESRGDTADVLVEATLVVARAHARVRSIAGHAS